MNKNIMMISAVAVIATTLTGCISNDVERYSPDVMQAHTIQQILYKKVSVGKFNMAQDADKNHIMCRLGGNIYLPNKMTYSQYIKSAFSKTLLSANRYSDQPNKHYHNLSANIRYVDFNSFSGQWKVSAKVRVDQNKPVSILSTSKFGTSFTALSACKNVAKGFPVAVQNFVNKTLKNRKIRRQLNK